MEDEDDAFASAVEVVQVLATSGVPLPDDLALLLYGLYKQATVGPCKQPKPAFYDLKGRAKWGAWNELGDMPTSTAKEHYVEVASSIPGVGPEEGGDASNVGGPSAVSMPANVEGVDSCKLGEYPLHEAVGSGALESVKELLIDGNVDVNARDEVGATALHMAANVGSVEMVKLLLDHDADIEARDEDGLTPLAHAAISCDEDIVQTLLEAGADGSFKTPRGQTYDDILRGQYLI
ncbi:hypothetical protein H632_c1359p1 [Helicosporidium sp. ATCC 50920]|nr:hypothetical protein H632_c1359p1 [Helicosporidium sp. ATCC 50920]|eukprot:KDD74378.1 hypothetical protein H632_c1359p1 [Helicosporidium sp. ATCC 50920]